ncbi:MAG: hypothetical protein IJV62_03635 [Eggerthellaceae bacterium]|nr:hypothetical protein [Eggerthellaceae bacterium]
MHQTKGKISFIAVLSACMLLFSATPAMAVDDVSTTSAQLSQAQIRVQETSKTYDEASKALEESKKKADENQAKVDEVNEQLPMQMKRAADSVKSMYMMQENSTTLLDLILSAEDFYRFINTMKYVDTLQNRNSDELIRLNDLYDELSAAQEELDKNLKEAEEKEKEAQKAMEDAIAARQSAQAAADAAMAAEAALAAEALTASQDVTSFTNASGNTVATEKTSTTTVSSDTVDWSSGKTDFVNKWAPRIDAYLAGSPLAGRGKTFASAAWDNGVDPRWSPAISNIESTKGRYCANSYNAWGWTAVGGGFRSFSDWDSAINSHVAYLAQVYGSNITPAAAKKYCPPNWQSWYSKVSANMNQI